MRPVSWASLAWLILGSALWAADQPKDQKADKPKTPQEQYQAITEEFNKAQQDFSKEYQKAKTDEERQKVFEEKYPKAQDYAKRFLKLAEDNPKDPAALDALVWIAQNSRQGPENDKALDILFKDHLDSPKLGQVCMMLVYSGTQDAEKLLRKVMEKSPHQDVQGYACYALGQLLKRTSEKDAEKQFEELDSKYGNVKVGKGTFADLAKPELFEIRNLGIGKAAPEIAGEDVDGKKFKLSDYRGKVVVLDFWGNW